METTEKQKLLDDTLKSEYFQLLLKKEDLCDELKKYHEKGSENSFEMVRHPLIFSVPHSPQMNAMCNYNLIRKKAIRQKYLDDKDYAGYIFIHEKPYRLDAFLEIEDKLTNIQYWQLLSEVWTNSENIWQHLSKWKELLSDKRSGKMYFMDAEERKALKSLPDTVTVYRGCRNHNKNGLSYTLDKSRADFFAHRYRSKKGGDGKIIEKQVPKKKIFAYLKGRNEDEVIIL